MSKYVGTPPDWVLSQMDQTVDDLIRGFPKAQGEIEAWYANRYRLASSPSADRELEGDSLGTHEGLYSSISKDGDCGDSDAARTRERAPLPICYSLVDHLTEMHEKGWDQSGCEYEAVEIRLKHGEGMRVNWAWNELPDQKEIEIVTRADFWSGARHQTEWFSNYYTLRYLRQNIETGDTKETFRTSVANVGRPWG